MPQNYDKTLIITVTDGTDPLTVSYSPMQYISKKYVNVGYQTMRDLAAYMYQYHTAALSYLENPGTIEDVDFFTNASIGTGVK